MATEAEQWRHHAETAERILAAYREVFDGMTPAEARRLRSLESAVEKFATDNARNPVVGMLIRDARAFSGLLRNLWKDVWEPKEST